MIVFVIIQEMDCDRGGGASVVAVYDDEDKANEHVAELRQNPTDIRYKYPTSWWVDEYVLNQKDRWA